MNGLVFLTAILVVAYVVPGAFSQLSCYVCVPILQSGEDCGQVKSEQLQRCSSSDDVCRVTAVSLPGKNGVRTPIINRQCAQRSDSTMAQVGNNQFCTTYSEGQRVSKMCQCSFTGCNSMTMDQLVDNRGIYGFPNGAISTGAINAVICLSTFFMLVFSKLIL